MAEHTKHAEELRQLGEAAADRFADAYGRTALGRDRELVPELRRDAVAVLSSLMDGLEHLDGPPQSDARELREPATLVNLFGRRAGELGVSPTAALALVPHLLSALPQGDLASISFQQGLTAVCVEGYCAGQREQWQQQAVMRLRDVVGTTEIAPGLWLALIRGDLGADVIEPWVDRLGRQLLDADARVLVTDLRGASAPDRATAARFLALPETCAMLGVRLLLTSVSTPWREAFDALGVTEALSILAWPEGFQAALRLVGQRMTPRSPWMTKLSDVFRKERGRP